MVLSMFTDQIPVIVIDNSPNRVSQLPWQHWSNVIYYHTGYNAGYGEGHNIALKLAPPSDFHLVINPDIILHSETLWKMLCYMNKQPDIALLSPKILNPDGSVQRLNRRTPAVLDLILRHIPDLFVTTGIRRRLRHHEMMDVGYESECDVECMSGAFMLLRRSVFEQIGGFDPRYFMYFEDFDLCKRLQKAGFRTVYYPEVSVTHQWERASSKQINMTFTHIRSMILFFNKFGWHWF